MSRAEGQCDFGEACAPFLRLASCVLRLASCVLRLASCVLRLASCVLRLAATPFAQQALVPCAYVLGAGQVGTAAGAALAVLNSLTFAQCDDVNLVHVDTSGCPSVLSHAAVSFLDTCRREVVNFDGTEVSRVQVLNLAHAKV